MVWTDHKNLAYIQSANRLNARQARWALFIGRFNFSLIYRPGTRNAKPDTLSRLHEKESESGQPPETIIPPSCVVAVVSWRIETEVKAAQQAQPDPGNGPLGRLFVPDTVKSRVLHWAHLSKLTCHPGVTHTWAFLRKHFWWPSMEDDT